jgi:hypothetical protein
MNDSGSIFEGLRDRDAEIENQQEKAARDKFRTRRETIPVRKVRGSEETIHTFSIRCRVSASNVFVRFCNERRMTYREGMDFIAAYLEDLDPTPDP